VTVTYNIKPAKVKLKQCTLSEKGVYVSIIGVLDYSRDKSM